MKAVILAAGYGNRLQPFTSFRPKHMLPVAGKYVLERGIEYLRDVLGIREFVIVVGYLRQGIIDYFGTGKKHDVNIKYVIQHTTDNRGVAAALALVEDCIRGDFILYLADNLFQADLAHIVKQHFEEGNHATIHIEKHLDPSRFGVVVMDDDGNILKVLEKPKNPPSNFVISGFYVLSPIIFKYIRQISPSKRGEYEISDAIQALITDGGQVRAALIDGWRQDVGYPSDLLEANKKFLDSGYGEIVGTIENSTIVPPVYIGKNARILNSRIGPYAMIERDVFVSDSRIAHSVILEETKIMQSVLLDSVIGAKAELSNVKGKGIIFRDYSVFNIC